MIEYTLPLSGFKCQDRETFGWLVLVDEGGTEARILLKEEHWAQADALVERRACVQQAVSTDDSELRLVFDGGESIVVPPDPDFEAWEVRVGEGGHLQVFAQPGGGEPSVFDAR